MSVHCKKCGQANYLPELTKKLEKQLEKAEELLRNIKQHQYYDTYDGDKYEKSYYDTIDEYFEVID